MGIIIDYIFHVSLGQGYLSLSFSYQGIIVYHGYNVFHSVWYTVVHESDWIIYFVMCYDKRHRVYGLYL